jgi:hypothetical protein
MTICMNRVRCQCGHRAFKHKDHASNIHNSWCIVRDCKCSKYQKDNLSYLERCYEYSTR